MFRRSTFGAAVLATGLLVATSCASTHPGTATTSTTSTPAPPSTTPPTATPLTATPTPITSHSITAAHPCAGTAPPRIYQHVVWIMMENRGLDQVAGSPSAPYLNSLAAACGLATNYHAISHPSLPNYIAATSGSTHGIGDDAGPGSHPLAGPSLFSLLGGGWRSLEESMPSNCDRSSSGNYAVKHNPAPYYTAVSATCPAQDVPLASPPDLSARFTFITPNLCNDMHDCSTATGDTWLAHEVPAIVATPEYQSGSTALFITWDENDAGGTLVPLYVVAPSVPPGTQPGTQPATQTATQTAASYSHYSLLRTTEEMLGLTPLLGGAATAADMRASFHL